MSIETAATRAHPCLLAGPLLAVFGMGSAHAQDSTAASAPLEEIVVTAQKRTESLQDVPISVAVVSGESLQQMGALSLRDLTSSIPDVKVVKAGPSDRLYIRGIGSGDNFSFDQSVGTFVDGIYHGRSRASAASFLDIDRMEFLKGPQSVYFGNSAIGGAINVTTRRPSAQVSGDFSAAYNFDWHETVLEGALGGPLSDTVAGRLSAMYSNGDGWLDDIGTGDRVPRTNNRAVRGQLSWSPSDELSFNLKAEAGRFRQEGGILIQFVNCPPTAEFGVPRGFCPVAIGEGLETQLDERRGSTAGQHTYLDNEEYVLNAEYALANATLSSVSGYLTQRLNSPNDPDGPVPDNLFAVALPESYTQFSQELRIASRGDRRIDYLAGLYFQHDNLHTQQNLTYAFRTGAIAANPAFAALVPYLPLGQAFVFSQTEDIYSAFGALTFHLGDRWRLVTGLRGTIVEKSADKALYFGTGHFFEPGITPFPANLQALSLTLTNAIAPTVAAEYDRKDDDITPSLNLQYDLTDNVLLYAGYSNGFKAGGFNGQDASPDQMAVPFGPEKVDAYELGLKSELLDGRMTLNLALFRGEYRDLQVGGARPFVTSPAATIQNAGGARSQGLEIEQRWAITRAFTSRLSVLLLDSEYTEYPNANPTSLQAVQGIARQDLSGARTPYSPKISGTWRLDYGFPLARGLELNFGTAAYYTSHYNMTTNNDPYLEQSGYAKWDASVGLSDPEAGWDAAILVRNVTDKRYLVYGAAAPTSLGSYSMQIDPPRSVTAQVRWRF